MQRAAVLEPISPDRGELLYYCLDDKLFGGIESNLRKGEFLSFIIVEAKTLL